MIQIVAHLRIVHKVETYSTAVLFNLHEAFVETQVVAHRVFPATRGSTEKLEIALNPVVNLLDRQTLFRRVVNGHEDEATEGVGRLAILVLAWVVVVCIGLIARIVEFLFEGCMRSVR